MRIVVIGAGVGGLGSALALSRLGHEVVVLERDRTPLPHDPDEAFEWDRRGAPQVRHSHAMLARLRNVLRDRYPDVLEALHAAGATDWPLTTNLPETLDDRSAKPGDEDLVMLACRRTTFEWVLRRTVLAAPHVSLLDGVVVNGLIGGDGSVRGVDASVDGESTVFEADLVVAANGRRGDVPAWLDGVGVAVDETVEDTGIIYLSRFYRLRDGAEVPPAEGAIGGDLGYLKYATFVGDNRTFSVTFATPVDDDELRSRLLDPVTFERAGYVLPATRAWVDAARADPITPVHVMAKLLNRLRRFTDDTGKPLARGFVAVGDAHTCTNPLYGRGCSLAMVQATLLADAVDAHAGAIEALDAIAADYERASTEQIEPWYHAAVMADRDSREPITESDADESDPRAFMRAVMRDGLAPAMRTDQAVLRAFIRTFNLLTTPDALLRDGDVVTAVLAAYNDRDNRTPEPLLGPESREELLAQL
jgi:2-polyprenyl-6-methoxyphenol hydroxylase-like FAD-dependent oxidoreductase